MNKNIFGRNVFSAEISGVFYISGRILFSKNLTLGVLISEINSEISLNSQFCVINLHGG